MCTIHIQTLADGDDELPDWHVQTLVKRYEIAVIENESNLDFHDEVFAQPLNVTIENTAVGNPPLSSPEDIRPIPKNVLVSVNSRKRRTKKSEIFTSTPVKNKIKLNALNRELVTKAREKKKATVKKENSKSGKEKPNNGAVQKENIYLVRKKREPLRKKMSFEK